MDFWKHGRYIDLWSLVHLLSGASLALMCYWLAFGFWSSVLISFLVLALWEVFEWMIGIIEPSINVSVDIAIGALGFLIGAYWHYFLGNAFDLKVLIACVTATLGLSLWGFLDFYFHGYR